MDVDLTDLQNALDRDQMVPCFQPVVGLHTGRLTGFELLARWQHPEQGPILPPNLISLAEENGLIGRLMRQVFAKAFAAAVILESPLLLSVNISPVQLRDEDLTSSICEMAQQTGFSLKKLMVEITESALLTDLKRARQIALELKELGCKLALDDFGTGYSSLAHLQALPFDELKVDRSFISSMTNTRESRKIVASIVGLGHSLGLITVAEGVETEAQADMLLWLGCEQGQGWLYGYPVAADQMAEIIAAPPRQMSPRSLSPGEGWAASSLEALPTQRLAQLQAIYDGAPVGLCFLDRNFRYISLNQRLADINRMPAAAHLGRSVQEIYPSLFAKLEPFLQGALKGEAISDLEVEVHGNDFSGRALIKLISLYPALDEADEVIGISVAVLDITEQKRAAEDVQLHRSYNEHLMQTGNRIPWIMDKEGNSLEPSSRWVLTAKLGKGRTRHLQWLEAVHVDDLETTMKIMQESLRTGSAIDIEYRVRDIDGEWKWMRSTGSPKRGEDGEILRWYGTVAYSDRNGKST